MDMRDTIRRRALAGAAATGILLLRLLWPGVFGGIRDLLVDRRGDEAVRAVFQAWQDGKDLRSGAVRVFGEDGT